jgi:hypothetical protein
VLSPIRVGTILIATLLAGCVGNKSPNASGGTPPPVVNTMAVSVDSGPAAATGAINHAYVTVRVCAPGSTTQCANIDHVRLDTGSWGLRLVGSVLAAGAVTLSGETDSQGRTIEECVNFAGGQTWGPVVLADVTLAGEVAAKVPLQILNDTGAGAPPPATCGANGSLMNDVSRLYANGLLGVGVLIQDCGAACVNAASPLPIYYGCTSAGVCTAENVSLAEQVTNPVTMFAADNNGIIVNMPNLINANGDASVQGELTFGIATQSDNALPAGLTVLGADAATGDFTATYNGGSTVLRALIDSGNDAYGFDDPAIPVCTTAGIFNGYYCPTVAPKSTTVIVSGVGVNNATSTVNFAIADPRNFSPNAAAFADLGGGRGSTAITLGMPFFYGRKIYLGIDGRAAGAYTGPYYAY